MTLNKKLLVTITIQAVGAISNFLLAVIIAHKFGPDGQGYLSYFRSTIEFLSGIVLFGFPQSIIYLINTKTIQTKWVAQFSLIYSGTILLICLSMLLIVDTTQVSKIVSLDSSAIIAVVISMAGMIIHGLYRSISITKNANYQYNLLTILPPLLTATIYVSWQSINYHSLIWASVIVAFISAVSSIVIVGENPYDNFNIHSSFHKIKLLYGYGFWSFLSTISLTLTSTFTYRILQQTDSGYILAGYFSVSLLALSLIQIPLSMVSPILVNDWSKHIDKQSIWGEYIKFARIGWLIAGVSLLLSSFAVKPITLFIFGIPYLPSVMITQILLFSSFILYQSRLLSCFLLAVGDPRNIGLGFGLRAIIILIMLSTGISQSLTQIAWTWNLGEIICMCYLVTCVQKHTNISVYEVLGLFPMKIPRSWSSIF